MTSPTRDTPPPRRPSLGDPPPAPRKLGRGVRKRRRPRPDDNPACTVCKRRRPLRASGLCWSLACALKIAQEDTTEGAEGTAQQFLNQRIRGEPMESDEPLPAQAEPPDEPREDDPELQVRQTNSSDGGNNERPDDERGGLVEEILRQDKDVDRGSADDGDEET